MIACEAYIYGLRNGCDVVQYVQVRKYREQHEEVSMGGGTNGIRKYEVVESIASASITNAQYEHGRNE